MGGLLGRHRNHLSQCRELSVARNVIGGIGTIEREGGATLLKPKAGGKRRDLHFAGDRRAVFAQGPELVC